MNKKHNPMSAKRLLTTITALTLALTVAWAQGPNNSGTYYKNADGKKGQALKTAMYEIIKTHTTLSYDNGLIPAYEKTDKRPDGKVRDWYSNATNYNFSQHTGSYSGEGDMYNKEHSFPKSWFGGKVLPMYSDIVHVVPADGYVNNMRSNYLLAKVGTVSKSSKNNYSKVGTCATSGYSGTVFEPNDEIKGDLARIYFYMVTCYEDKITSWAGNATASAILDGTTYPAFKTWYLNMLMEWSKNDPIDDVEIARNNAVYEVQKNRNPFVDYPGLEDYVWGDKKTVAFSYDNFDGTSTGKQSVTMTFSAATATATLGETFTAPTLSTSPSGLAVTYSSSNTSVATVNSSTGAVTLKAAGTTTITAAFAGNDNYYANSASYTLTVKQQGSSDEPTMSGEGIYELVSSTADLESGKNYIIVSGEKALTKFDGTKGTGSVTISNSQIDLNNSANEALVLVLEKVGDYWTVKNGSNYMALTSNNNTLNSATSASENTAKWTISITSGTASVVNASFTSRSLKYNNSSDMFRCYTSGQASIAIYKELEAEETTLLGDVNKDGKVNIADVKALVEILLGKDESETRYDHKAADANTDGKVTIADVTALVNVLLGRVF